MQHTFERCHCKATCTLFYEKIQSLCCVVILVQHHLLRLIDFYGTLFFVPLPEYEISDSIVMEERWSYRLMGASYATSFMECYCTC